MALGLAILRAGCGNGEVPRTAGLPPTTEVFTDTPAQPGQCQNRTHLPKQIQILATQMPSRNDNGTRGREPVEELKVINVARAPARFRALPDDTGIALNGDKPVARVGPILKLLDGHVIAGLAAGRPVKSARGILTMCGERLRS